MKKIFTLIAVALMTVCANAATTTVGAEDNSTDWWTAFSDYYTVKEGEQAHITFKNYSDKAANFHNWVLVTNVAGTERGASGYFEYFAVRPDNWGWGTPNTNANWPDYWDSSLLTSNYDNWDTYAADMDGTDVVIDLSVTDGVIKGTATITTVAGKVYTETFGSKNTGAKEFSFFLTCEKAHLTDVNVTISQIPTKTVELIYQNYGEKYANYEDADWGLVNGAKITADYYGTDSLVIRNWMCQKGYDLPMKYDATTGYVTLAGEAYGSYAGWAYCGPGTTYDYYAYVRNYNGQSWITKNAIYLYISFDYNNWYNYYLSTSDPTDVSTVTVDDPAETTTKTIENGQLIITKNGKKYNAAGAQIK